MIGHSYLSAAAGLIVISSQILAQSAGMFVRTGDMTTSRVAHTATLLCTDALRYPIALCIYLIHSKRIRARLTVYERSGALIFQEQRYENS
jgi:hypothetical protein